MNDLQVFDFGERQIRTVVIGGETWFVGRDVAEVLGYKDPQRAIRQHCKGRAKRTPLSSNGGTQNVRIVSEGDLFRLIVNSKLESALKFEQFVFEEVLPAIRKTGSFSAAKERKQVTAESFFKLSMDALNPNEGSRILMLDKFGKSQGLDTSFLPDYTEEKLTISLTELLKRSGIGISAMKANKILIEKGILEEKTRPSKKGEKKFKAFSEDGLRFGKNLINPQNQRETQPHFFDDVDIKELLN